MTIKGRRRPNNIRRIWLVDQLGKCAARTRGVIEVFSEWDWVWQVKADQIFLYWPGLQQGDFGLKLFDLQICDKGEPYHSQWPLPRAQNRLKITSIFSTKLEGEHGSVLSCCVKYILDSSCSLFVIYVNGVNLSLFRGQYAVVKRCLEKATGKEFAAKFVRKRRKGKDCRAEVWHEVEVLNATNFPNQHPQIITLYDVFETRSEVILILELWVFLRRSRVLFENYIFKDRTVCDVDSTAHSAEIYIDTVSLTIATNQPRVEAKEKWCSYSDRFSKV